MLTWEAAYVNVRRERQLMSKNRREAAGSAESAILRMARVDCNIFGHGRL